jgi:peptidoglycan/LPS O-acetylase OafA/YrhL
MTKSQSVLLDLIRGFSAQLVVIGHALSASGLPLKITIQDFGVVMFFILSGFLVTFSAMRKETFEEFFIDRAARMFTPYIPCLILIGLAGIFFGLHGPHDIKTFVANALMLQDFPLHRYISVPEIDRFGTGRPLWSVAMEWWFYMAFGALFFIRRLPIWALPLIGVGFFVTGFGATVGMLPYTWAAGAIAAIVWSRLPKAPWALLFAGFFALAVYRYRIAPDEFYDLRLNLLMAVSLFCAVKAVENVSVPNWIGKFGFAIAAYSYTLYLIHYTVMSIISVQSGWARAAVTLVVANVAAIVIYFAFERHYRKVAACMKAWMLPKRI